MDEKEQKFYDIVVKFLTEKCDYDCNIDHELNSGDLGILMNKNSVPQELLGCSFRELKEYIAEKNNKAITWADENY